MSTHEPDPPAEPLLTRGFVIAGVAAALGLLVAFGVHLSKMQTEAILGAAAVAAPLLVAWWARRRVYSPATVKRLLSVRREGVTPQ